MPILTTGQIRAAALVAGILTQVWLVSLSRAVLNQSQLKCSQAIARGGQGFVKGKLKLLQKCRKAHLVEGGPCTPDPAAVAKLEGKLASTIDKACNLPIANFRAMGFPGACADATPGSFELPELADCIRTSHGDFIEAVIGLVYDATVPGPLAASDLACQSAVAKQSAAFSLCLLKNVQKCRNDLNKGRPLGVPPDYCATDDPRTQAAIDKCKTKLTTGIATKCSDGQIASLKICTPDQTQSAGASSCLISELTVRIDGPDIAVPPDLIDFEYAVRGGLCGDNVINGLDEECDGTDDGPCPGQCGSALVPDGHFACLCKDKPRILVIEDGPTFDTDNGWTGQGSDTKVVDQESYVLDLNDCDGSGLCNVGPSCSLPPHSSCAVPEEAPSGITSDAICFALGQGTCRKERTAVGPHCHRDITKKCDPRLPADPVCDAAGDFCEVRIHGAPVAEAAGGVAVCNYSVFSEDIVGTVNLLDGTTSVKMRQRARTHLNLVGSQNKPCPVCGGFCGVDRERCAVDADCAPGQGPCVTALVCSDGPNKDRACRATPPFGGPVPLFGVTSVDCLPEPDAEITSGGLDLQVDPRTTATVSLLPTFPCAAEGFTGNTCLGGTSEGRICTEASECPGGTCSPQCFCAGQLRPNACGAACVGGTNDAAECITDSECPAGFCHAGDCRVDPLDLDSNQEGICTSGPNDRKCSVTSFRSCLSDAECGPPSCKFCQAGETCVVTKRACFVNSGIIRIGMPRAPVGKSVGAYCVPSNGESIDTGAGFPGPSALVSPETVVVVP